MLPVAAAATTSLTTSHLKPWPQDMQRHSPKAKASSGPAQGAQTTLIAVTAGGSSRRRHPFHRAQTTPRNRFSSPPPQHITSQGQHMHEAHHDGFAAASSSNSSRVVGHHQVPISSHPNAMPKTPGHVAPLPRVWSPGHDPRQARRRGFRPTPTRAVVSAQPAQTAQAPRTVPPMVDVGTIEQAHRLQELTFLREFTRSSAADSGTQRLWVCIRQQQPNGRAEVYLHDRHVDEAAGFHLPDLVAQQPLMTVLDTSFTMCPLICGPWHNYPIQFRGDFFLVHEQIEWPNEVRLYQPWQQEPVSAASNIVPYAGSSNRPSNRNSRTRRARSVSVAPAPSSLESQQQQHYDSKQWGTSLPASSSSSSKTRSWTVQRLKGNYNGLDDIVLWLADPSRERVMSHLANMVRQHSTKGVSIAPENLYGRLVQQWGSLALLRLDVTRQAVTRLVNDPATPLLYPISPARPQMSCMYRGSWDEDIHAHRSIQGL